MYSSIKKTDTEKSSFRTNLTACYLKKQILELENQKKFYDNKLKLILDVVKNHKNLTVRYLKKEIESIDKSIKLYELRLQETKQVLSK